MKWISLILGLLLILPVQALALESWYSSAYTMPITVMQGGSINLTNFSINVTYNLSYLMAEGMLDNNAQCLRFAQDETDLYYEFESYDNPDHGINGSTQIWVKIPTIPPENTTITMYFMDGCGDTFGNNTANAWDYNYTLIYHLSENVSGTGTYAYVDSLGIYNAHDGVSDNDKDGIFGLGQGFDGSDDVITSYRMGGKTGCVSSDYCYPNSDFTMDFWAVCDSQTKDFAGQHYNFRLSLDGLTPNFQIQDVTEEIDEIWFQHDFNDDMTASTWHHIGYVVDTSNDTEWNYLDGSIDSYYDHTDHGSPNLDEFLEWTGDGSFNLTIGGAKTYTNCSIDEFRVSNGTRTSDWMLRSAQQDLIIFGAITEPEAPRTSFDALIGIAPILFLLGGIFYTTRNFFADKISVQQITIVFVLLIVIVALVVAMV